MNLTRTAPIGLGFDPRRAMPRSMPAVRPLQSAAARPGWIERLAAWGDHQPMHHRMGSWERLR
jgi:hypothetical protein